MDQCLELVNGDELQRLLQPYSIVEQTPVKRQFDLSVSRLLFSLVMSHGNRWHRGNLSVNNRWRAVFSSSRTIVM